MEPGIAQFDSAWVRITFGGENWKLWGEAWDHFVIGGRSWGEVWENWEMGPGDRIFRFLGKSGSIFQRLGSTSNIFTILYYRTPTNQKYIFSDGKRLPSSDGSTRGGETSDSEEKSSCGGTSDSETEA